MNRNTFVSVSIACLAALKLSAPVLADVAPAFVFTDNAVLQRDKPIRVWGTADAGEKVSVTFSGRAATTTADAAGKWHVKLRALPASATPNNLIIKGKNIVTRSNILVGDVWVCSGQSNMRMGMGVIDAPADIAAANHPGIRLFSVAKTISMAPRAEAAGQWDVCTPQTVVDGGKDSWGGFSAVAYFFGRELHQKIKVPIGLIHTSWGGSVVEAWTDSRSLKTIPEFAPLASQLEAQAQQPNGENIELLMTNWWQQNDPGTKAGWQDSTGDAEAWKTTTLPGKWELSSLPGFDGVVWFRKEVIIPQEWAGKDVAVHLGAIDDRDTTFFNGTPVGSEYDSQKPRVYTVPGTLVKAGRNVITVRVLDTGGGGGFTAAADVMKLTAPDATAVSLAGAWSYRVSIPLKQTASVPIPIAGNHNAPTVLNNGMIAPLAPFGIKGAIWSQGESNAGRGKQYGQLLPAMIKGWRRQFGQGDFPFLIVQLANFMAPGEQPTESQWAELREAQAVAAQTTPNAGLAVSIDIGEANDIHPKNKQEVGRRLALAAQSIAYGHKLEYSGPAYHSMKAQDGKIRLRFDHAKGLSSKGGEKLHGFAIAGVDRKWVWADAAIEGKDVVLSSAGVPNPTMARYNWSDNPNGNLTSASGLPAVPFRTDSNHSKN